MSCLRSTPRAIGIPCRSQSTAESADVLSNGKSNTFLRNSLLGTTRSTVLPSSSSITTVVVAAPRSFEPNASQRITPAASTFAGTPNFLRLEGTPNRQKAMIATVGSNVIRAVSPNVGRCGDHTKRSTTRLSNQKTTRVNTAYAASTRGTCPRARAANKLPGVASRLASASANSVAVEKRSAGVFAMPRWMALLSSGVTVARLAEADGGGATMCC